MSHVWAADGVLNNVDPTGEWGGSTQEDTHRSHDGGGVGRSESLWEGTGWSPSPGRCCGGRDASVK